MREQQRIKLSYITADPDLQPRTGMNHETIEDYADDMRRGDRFPPIVVFYDGKKYRVVDGFHRLRAALAIKSKTILCEVRRGGKRDALLFSVSSNAAHGQRRSKDDKRMAVTKLLKDKEWSKWSDNEIARRCHVDNHTVIRLRKSLGKSPSERRSYTTKHGKTAKMKTGKIGKSRSPAKPKMPPHRDIEHGRILSALREIDEQVWSLQKASQGVTDFLSDHGHITLNSSRLYDMAIWLGDFAAAWEAASQTAETTHPLRTDL